MFSIHIIVDKPPAEPVRADPLPGSSIAFAKLVIDDELKELLRLVETDADTFNNLLDAKPDQPEPSSSLLHSLRLEPTNNRIVKLVLYAQRKYLLYSYCNLFYVANPYLRLYPELIDYGRFVDAAKLNWSIVVEPAALPAIDSIVRHTKLDQKDSIDDVLKRMKELSVAPAPATKSPDSMLHLYGEKLLLLDLLALDSAKRDQFIMECAIAHRLLVTNAKTGFLELNAGINGKCFDFLDVEKAVKTANQPRKQSNEEDGPDFIVESEELVAPKLLASKNGKQETAVTIQENEKKNSISEKDVSAINKIVEAVAKKVIPAVVKIAKTEKREAIPDIVKDDAKNKKADKKAVNPVVAKATKTSVNIVVPPVPATAKAAQKASRKAARKEAFLAANNSKQQPFVHKEPASTSVIHEQVEADLKEATKRMEQLMREYQYSRPDADPVVRGPKAERKRGARTKHVSLCSDSYGYGAWTPAESIMSSLRDIEDFIDQKGVKGLGPQYIVYQNFIVNFEKTLKRIKRKLYANPTVAPQSKVKLEKNEKPAPVPDSFRNDLQKMLQWHNCPMDLGANWSNPEDNSTAFEAVVQKLVNMNVGKLLEGVVRINAFNVNVAYHTSSESTEDAMIDTILLRQCAMHNDLVEVFVFTKIDQKRSNPSGFVTRILEKRNDRLVIGRCKSTKDKQNLVFVPTTKRVPNVFIDKKAQLEKYPSIQISDDLVYLARITGWKCEIPSGEIYRSIGLHNELATSNEAILIEHKLQVPNFSASIMGSLPNESFTIPPEEYAQRANLTTEYVFTIDPATARDLDDALSVEQLSNGNYKVGVHISDVTYFIPEFSELDEVIREQATSIYLVNTVYHMLPRSLCMTCSLLPGQDKLAFSVFWELTTEGEIISTHFGRTIINSCVQLAYSHAQRMIEESQHQYAVDELPTIREGFEASVIAEKVRLLHKLATPLRKLRFDRFCLTINQPKITFQLDEESGEPLTFERYQQMDSNWLIEEFMLLANQTVATRIYESFPDVSILRNHSAPKQNGLEALAGRLQALGFTVDFKTPEATARTMFRLTHDAKKSEMVEAVLTELLTKPMNRAL